MQAMLADLEAEGGAFVGGSRLVSGEAIPGGAGFRMQIEDVDTAETMPLHASLLVNAAGAGRRGSGVPSEPPFAVAVQLQQCGIIIRLTAARCRT